MRVVLCCVFFSSSWQAVNTGCWASWLCLDKRCRRWASTSSAGSCYRQYVCARQQPASSHCLVGASADASGKLFIAHWRLAAISLRSQLGLCALAVVNSGDMCHISHMSDMSHMSHTAICHTGQCSWTTGARCSLVGVFCSLGSLAACCRCLL